MKIAVVTGGAGFIGSHLCARLSNEGYRVISLDNYFAGSETAHHDGVEYRVGHTKDIAKYITETPDIIYHLGEYSRVQQSIDEPALVFDSNGTGTFGVLEFWRTTGAKLVYAGSSTKFGDSGAARYTTPYAWVKAMNTELVAQYAAWYDLSYAIVYFYNVYGPGERSGKYGTLIGIFAEQLAQGEPLTVEEPGTQKRNFTHVDDIIDGLHLVGEKGEGDGFGIGSKEAFSVREVAEMFGAPIVMTPPRVGNRMSGELVTEKTQQLGWVQKKFLKEEIDLLCKKIS